VHDVGLTFAEGRVTDVSGPPEASALREFVGRDAGTARLGELALVDADSRVAGLGQTFGEILLDENAASHIALGYGFPALVPTSGRGEMNSSDHHLDVMIGASSVDITGVARDGRSHPLLRGGRWAGGDSPRPTARPASPTAAAYSVRLGAGHQQPVSASKVA